MLYEKQLVVGEAAFGSCGLRTGHLVVQMYSMGSSFA